MAARHTSVRIHSPEHGRQLGPDRWVTLMSMPRLQHAIHHQNLPVLQSGYLGAIPNVQADNAIDGGYLPPFLTLSTRSRRPSVAVSIRPLAPFLIRNPGSGSRGSTVSSKRTRVESPSGVNV
jgi:hypothetical protein